MTEPGAAASPLLEVRGLRKYFRARGRGVEERLIKAVDDVSLSVSAGQTVALVGESGSGKSTTAYCILRLENVTAGSVFFQGQDITHLPARSLRPVRRDMNVIFQDPLASLNPRMTIGDIITEPLVVHGIGDPASRRARMHELLDRVGLRPIWPSSAGLATASRSCDPGGSWSPGRPRASARSRARSTRRRCSPPLRCPTRERCASGALTGRTFWRPTSRQAEPPARSRPQAGVWSLCTDQNALGGDGCA